jgi:hypothetical protein
MRPRSAAVGSEASRVRPSHALGEPRAAISRSPGVRAPFQSGGAGAQLAVAHPHPQRRKSVLRRSSTRPVANSDSNAMPLSLDRPHLPTRWAGVAPSIVTFSSVIPWRVNTPNQRPSSRVPRRPLQTQHRARSPCAAAGIGRLASNAPSGESPCGSWGQRPHPRAADSAPSLSSAPSTAEAYRPPVG